MSREALKVKRQLEVLVSVLEFDNIEQASFLFPRALCRAAEEGRAAPLGSVVDVWAVLVSYFLGSA